MSKLNVDTIEPEGASTTLTLGASGDTVDVPSGATLDVTGATVTGLSAGKVLQVVSTTKTDTFSTTGSDFVDITGLNAAITPAATTSKVLILVSISSGGEQDSYPGFKLLRGATTVAEGDTDASAEEVTFGVHFVNISASVYELKQASYSFLDSPSTTSATTYKVQVSPMRTTDRTAYINRSENLGDANQMVSTSTITLMEIEG